MSITSRHDFVSNHVSGINGQSYDRLIKFPLEGDMEYNAIPPKSKMQAK